MNVLFAGMIGMSLIFGILCGRLPQLSQAALEQSANAVNLAISLAGSLCLWSGVMKVAERSGATDALSKWMSPVISRLFRAVAPTSKAAKLICMNMAANLIGLGNATTPLGIAAMRELEQISGKRKTATNSMVMFVVLNTASLQIIPTTTAMLRLNAGSRGPMEILPAVWAASLCSVISGVVMAAALAPFFKEQ